LLGFALFDLPYGYYQFLRIVVTIASIAIAIKFNSAGNSIGVVIFGVLAVLYNPIVKIHMERETHEIVNIATVLIFAASWLLQSKLENNSPSGRQD
jgi:hypothetical protein